MQERITQLIEEIKAIQNDTAYVPKTMAEVEKNHEIMEALNAAIVSLESAISDEPLEIATQFKNEDEAIEIAYN